MMSERPAEDVGVDGIARTSGFAGGGSSPASSASISASRVRSWPSSRGDTAPARARCRRRSAPSTRRDGRLLAGGTAQQRGVREAEDIPRPIAGFVQAQASPRLTRPSRPCSTARIGSSRRPSPSRRSAARRRASGRGGPCAARARSSGRRRARPSASCRAWSRRCHRPGAVVGGQRQHRVRAVVRGDRPADRGLRRRGSSACSRGSRRRRCARCTLPGAEQPRQAEPRPMASTTSSPVSRSPVSVRTAGACPERCSSAATVTPRRISIPSWASAADAMTCSIVLRRAVQVTKRSSPSRGSRSVIFGGITSAGRSAARRRRRAPGGRRAARRRARGGRAAACSAPGGTGSRRRAPSAPRPRRGRRGTAAVSRSSTVTRWPSRASMRAAASPHRPPPRMIVWGITPARRRRRGVYSRGGHKSGRSRLLGRASRRAWSKVLAGWKWSARRGGRLRRPSRVTRSDAGRRRPGARTTATPRRGSPPRHASARPRPRRAASRPRRPRR